MTRWEMGAWWGKGARQGQSGAERMRGDTATQMRVRSEEI
jgi:hypothetical protein